jgi:hypothetical protein
VTELRCPACGYDVRGLEQPRCPECGREFRWPEAVAPRHRPLDETLFEFQWRRRPVRSLLVTIWSAAQPWRFWPRLAASGPPRILPLLLSLLITYVAYAVLDSVRGYAAELSLWQLMASRVAGWAERIPAPRLEMASHFTIGLPFYLGGLLTLLGAACMCSAGSAHTQIALKSLVRLVCYAALPAPALLLLLSIVLSTWYFMIEWSAVAYTPGGMQVWWVRNWPLLHRHVCSIVLAFVIGSFCWGAASYLRLRLGWLWGLNATMLAVTICFAIVMALTLQVYGTLDNPWLEMLEAWVPGTEWLAGYIVRGWHTL